MKPEIEDDGVLVVASDFWARFEEPGVPYLSCRVRTARLLVPKAQPEDLDAMRQGRRGILVCLEGVDSAPILELTFDNRQAFPWRYYFSPDRVDRLPAEEDDGRDDLTLIVYTRGPVEVFRLPMTYRDQRRLRAHGGRRVEDDRVPEKTVRRDDARHSAPIDR